MEHLPNGHEVTPSQEFKLKGNLASISISKDGIMYVAMQTTRV
jgi:hypothetical protein